MQHSLFKLLIISFLVSGCLREIRNEYPEAFIAYNRCELEENKTAIRAKNLDPYYSRLKFMGFPIGKTLVFSQERPLKDPGNYELIDEFTLLPTGEIHFKSGKIVDTLEIYTSGFIPGESLNCRFEAKEDSFSYNFEFVPVPLKVESEDKDFTFEAKVLSIQPPIYELKTSPLDEEEGYSFIPQEGDSVIENTFSGNCRMMFRTGLPGIPGGFTPVSIKRESGEVLTLNIPWGIELFSGKH